MKVKTNRVLSFILCLIMVFGMIPAMQTDAQAAQSESGRLSMTLSPLYGNANGTNMSGAKWDGSADYFVTHSPVTMSFTGTIYHDKNDGHVIWNAPSCTGVSFSVAAYTSSGGYDAKKHIYTYWGVDLEEINKISPYKMYTGEQIDGLGHLMHGKGDGTGDNGSKTDGKGWYTVYTALSEEQITSRDDGHIIYMIAELTDEDGTTVTDRVVLSATIKHATKATTINSRYKGLGFQVRVVNGIPIGPNDYGIQQGKDWKDKTANTRGVYRQESAANSMGAVTTSWYDAVNEWSGTCQGDYKTHSAIYHDMSTEEQSKTVYSAVSFSNEVLDNFFRWYNAIFRTAPESNLVYSGADAVDTQAKETITIQGPRIIEAYYGVNGEAKDTPKNSKAKVYNLAYYSPDNDTAASPDRYTTWGSDVQEGFEEWRFVTFIIPNKNTGVITINCYDISMLESGATEEEARFYQETITTTRENALNGTNGTFFLNNSLWYAYPYVIPSLPDNQEQIDEVYGITATFYDAVTTALGREGKGIWTSTAWDVFEQHFKAEESGMAEYLTKRNEEIFSEDTAVPSWVTVAHKARDIFAYMVGKTGATTEEELERAGYYVEQMVTIPTNDYLKSKLGDKMKGEYTFEHGFVSDVVPVFGNYRELIIPPTMESTVVVMHSAPEGKYATLNLYYTSEVNGKYTVKVEIDGVEQPDLEKTYDKTPIGKIIESDDVKVPPLPDGIEVIEIDGTPLEIDDTPEDNIITIKAGHPPQYIVYKVRHFLDDKLHEVETLIGEGGRIIQEDECIRGYDGYIFDHSNGAPLELKEAGGVIDMYYKSVPAPRAADPNVMLFDKDPKAISNDWSTLQTNQVTKYKSGYGFWAYFAVAINVRYNGDGIAKIIKDYGEKAADGTMSCKSATNNFRYTWETPKRCGVIPHDANIPYYRNVTWTATATWTDGLSSTNTISETGRPMTVNLVCVPELCTATRVVFRLPKHPYSKVTASDGSSGLYKAYIPVKWADNTNWTVSFTFDCTYESAVQHRMQQGPHHSHPNGTPPGGSTPCTWWYPNIEGYAYDYDEYSLQSSGTGRILVLRNMYEDDFTGDRK